MRTKSAPISSSRSDARARRARWAPGRAARGASSARFPAGARLALVAFVAFLAVGCAAPPLGAAPPVREPSGTSTQRRPFPSDGWPGPGVAYGPHRDGQRPGGASPTRAQIREDLALLKGRFGLLRLYASDGPTPDVLAVIHEDRLPFRVLLGAWIAPESEPVEGGRVVPIPGAREANAAQVAAAVRLANAYPGIVAGLCIGNETQVSWSSHRLPARTLVGWLRAARRGTRVPVATADDFGFWVRPESDRIAREVDFIVTHVYAMWNGRLLKDALAFTRAKYAEVARRHPGLPVVLGEAGWATQKHPSGEQATLIRAEASEAAQRRFYADFKAWVTGSRIVAVWFEAFDERWKGGPEPDDVEKHWGLFRADRAPKPAAADAP